MAYQMTRRMREIKTDIESSMFANKARVAGNDTTARVLAGIGSWVVTNVNNIGTEVVYLAASQLQVAIDNFTGMNNQRSYLQANQSGRNSIVNAVDVYVTPWGTVEMVPSRHVRNQDVWILEKNKWQWADLRPMRNQPLAKTGDNEKRQLVCEGTLVALNEKSSGLVADCS